MQQTLTPVPFEKVRREAERVVASKIGRGRFTKSDARYDLRRGQVDIGIWLPDRKTADYSPYFWRLKRATIHWRLNEIIVSNAVNYELQIDKETPFAQLTAMAFEPRSIVAIFGETMRITVGVSEVSVAVRQTETIRTDWGIKGFALR